LETVLVSHAPAIDPEVALVRSMADGDEGGLRALYATHGRRLLAYAYRLTGSRALAEEVLQESLLAAWRGARTYRGEGRVISWLLGIVHRQALNATRRKALPATSLEEAAQAGIVPTVPASDPSPALDRQQALAAALAELSVEHRSALELVFYQALTLAEAAQVCGCPVGTIKSRLSYAKARVRDSLERAGIGAEDLL
jgi:RNA polymerase sigma-70 factor (ECF subfamily)